MMSNDDNFLAPSEHAKWYRPRDAVLTLVQSGLSPEKAIASLLVRLNASLVRAVAGNIIWRPRNGEEERAHCRFIPPNHWNPDSEWVPAANFWEGGDIYFDLTSESGGYDIHVSGRILYFDVRFDPTGVSALLQSVSPYQSATAPLEPAPPKTEAGPQPHRNPGGRPPKPFWEDAIIEVARQIWEGELQPQRQADIEKAFHDWLVANGHAAGETQVRGRARKLFQALKS